MLCHVMGGRRIWQHGYRSCSTYTQEYLHRQRNRMQAARLHRQAAWLLHSCTVKRLLHGATEQ